MINKVCLSSKEMTSSYLESVRPQRIVLSCLRETAINCTTSCMRALLLLHCLPSIPVPYLVRKEALVAGDAPLHRGATGILSKSDERERSSNSAAVAAADDGKKGARNFITCISFPPTRRRSRPTADCGSGLVEKARETLIHSRVYFSVFESTFHIIVIEESMSF